MTTRAITKSIRFSPSEAEEIARISAQDAVTEAALMKKWVLEGVHARS